MKIETIQDINYQLVKIDGKNYKRIKYYWWEELKTSGWGVGQKINRNKSDEFEKLFQEYVNPLHQKGILGKDEF